jgi:hypothetical protein
VRKCTSVDPCTDPPPRTSPRNQLQPHRICLGRPPMSRAKQLAGLHITAWPLAGLQASQCEWYSVVTLLQLSAAPSDAPFSTTLHPAQHTCHLPPTSAIWLQSPVAQQSPPIPSHADPYTHPARQRPVGCVPSAPPASPQRPATRRAEVSLLHRPFMHAGPSAVCAAPLLNTTAHYLRRAQSPLHAVQALLAAGQSRGFAALPLEQAPSLDRVQEGACQLEGHKSLEGQPHAKAKLQKHKKRKHKVAAGHRTSGRQAERVDEPLCQVWGDAAPVSSPSSSHEGGQVVAASAAGEGPAEDGAAGGAAPTGGGRGKKVDEQEEEQQAAKDLLQPRMSGAACCSTAVPCACGWGHPGESRMASSLTCHTVSVLRGRCMGPRPHASCACGCPYIRVVCGCANTHVAD